ncbi:MAG: type IV toxin-antitoxin system AbiEi family antitoxin domain-containing protein [Acidimicrobiia bacterium]
MGAIDKAAFELAERQHFVFTRAQARTLGATDSIIKTRLRSGRWVRLASGIYAMPGTVGTRGRLKAATLAVPGSVASHESAAELHNLSYVPRDKVVVTADPGANHRHGLAVVHEYAGIDEADVTSKYGIPVTSQALTVFHLADVLPGRRLERVLDDQLNRGAVEIDDLTALVDFWTRKGRNRARVMRSLIATRGPGYVAPESHLEASFVELVRTHNLPEPVRQFATPWDPQEGRVDFAYPAWMMLIEVDGRRWHGRDADNEKDRARDRRAQLNGWNILRFTYSEVTRRADSVAREIRGFIDQAQAG